MIKRLVLFAILNTLCTATVAADQVFGISVTQSELAFITAQHAQGVSTELGRLGPPDYAAAARSYRKAAVLGLPLAQNNLARLYESGRGVPQNYVLAHVWYTLASVSGDEVIRANRDSSARRLTPEQLARAQRIAGRLKQQLP